MNDPDLDRLLRTWSAPPAPADEFRRGVWQRIAHGAAAAPRWQRWLETLFHPRTALAGLAAALVLGAAGGAAHGALTIRSQPVASAGAEDYVQSINPLNPAHLHHDGTVP